MSQYFKKNGTNLRGSSVVGCGRWNAGKDRTSGRAEFEIGGAKGARRIQTFRCGSNWTCEVCARANVARYRSWIRAGLMPALEAAGKSASLVTLTLSHHYGENWGEVTRRLLAAFGLWDKRMAKGYKKAGYIGKVKSFEVTVGKNGLHPHFHLLVTHDKDADVEQLEVAMRAAWEKAVTEEGGRCTEHGFDFKANCINDYVAKMESAHELSSQNTKQGRKKGRTLSQLLDAIYRGDQTAAHEWTRAIQALEGVNRFNAGALPKKLGIPTPSEWEDEEENDQGELDLAEDPTVVDFSLDDLLQATHPSLGRPGMAMILRALDRGGEAGGRAMLEGLLRDYVRTRAPWTPAWMTAAADPGGLPAIIETAKTRPLTRDEVAEYLRVIKNRSASCALATA
ncbi:MULTISPECIES: hypothetical protein [Janthinobacterium]|uniref:hypothetical protein n=1 Tax=Janthinobacterium TaxID=29580 RepID=UPI0011854D6E|nr:MULTISPECIES: hypothetical protein [Janthinobacterium]